MLLAGGTDGIGLALLKQLFREHDAEYAKCYVIGRNFARLEKQTVSKWEKLVPLQCDITDTAALEARLAEIPEEIDEFVNTVGTFYRGKAVDTPLETIQKHFDLNTVHNIKLTQLVVPKLKKGFSQVLVCLATLAMAARHT